MSKVALITGTTSNLGMNIAYRLVDELPQSTNLTLIVTSRTLPRVKNIITEIKNYTIEKHPNRQGHVEFDYLLLDFTDMVSVLSAYYDLTKKYTHIDYLFMNSVQGVFTGISWGGAIREIAANPLEGVTNPTYKIQKVGVKSNDDMGLVFQANVFGPYYLIHKIMPLLRDSTIVWVSSIMSEPKYLSFNDLELVESPAPYEGSKRLIDLVHFATYQQFKKSHNINSYLVNPGIFTSFAFHRFLNVFTTYGMLLLFYLARFLGSPYHNISGYTAANAPVSAALNDEVKDKKISSCTDRFGREYLTRNDVDTTGAEDVLAFLNRRVELWDEKLKHQIKNTRQP